MTITPEQFEEFIVYSLDAHQFLTHRAERKGWKNDIVLHSSYAKIGEQVLAVWQGRDKISVRASSHA